MKLNIGAGNDIRIGWENTDQEEDWFTTKRPKESVDAILFNHCAMYIRPEEMNMLLKKWYVWLKRGGTLHIETQNLDKIGTDLRLLYGEGDNAGHRWAWTPSELGKLMRNAGFNNVTSIPGILHGWPERDFLITGTKI